MKQTIRTYEHTDLSRVLSAWENASNLAHPFLTPEFLALERQRLPAEYLPHADTWVAEVSGEVVGFISLVGREIGGLFVQPAYHRQGVGRALVHNAQTLHDQLEVEVFEANSIGRHFYASCGFTLLSTKQHEETGHTLLRLKLTK